MTKALQQFSGVRAAVPSSRGERQPLSADGQAALPGVTQMPLSRRRLLRLVAGGTAGALSAGLWLPTLAQSEDGGNGDGTAAPQPIPGGIQVTPDLFIHFYFPGSGSEPSLITDFNGWVGVAELSGTGVAGDGTPLGFHTDMRFMKGLYVGEDGARHRGAFAFI